MNARVMISSVSKDQVPLGNLQKLGDFWYQNADLPKRLKDAGCATDPAADIPFSFIRAEVNRHLTGKYGFEVYIHEGTPGAGRNPEEETLLEARRCQLVIGIFGTRTGFTVQDQDPLTPTLREWRAALETPLKFKVFILKDSLDPGKLPTELASLMGAISDYKKGKVYMQFADVIDLFQKLDDTVRVQVNMAMIRYAADTIAREPNPESEVWHLLPYRTRAQQMLKALQDVAAYQGIKSERLKLGNTQQPVSLHCVPDSFAIPESKKNVAYIFEDEGQDAKPDEPGKLHVVAAFGSVTELQIRRHLGNFEAAEVYPAPWGIYAADPATGIQCVYLPRCTNSLVMGSKVSQAISWLAGREQQIAILAARRRDILKLLAGPAAVNAAPQKSDKPAAKTGSRSR